MLSFVRGMYLWRTRTETHILQCLVKPGVGIAIPDSRVYLNGIRSENVSHVAGYVAGLEASVRYIYLEQVFIEVGGKAGYANFSNVLNMNGNSAKHTFTSFQCIASIGWLFRL